MAADRIEMPAFIETAHGWIPVGQATRADLLVALKNESTMAWQARAFRTPLRQCGGQLVDRTTVGQILSWLER